MKKQTITQTYRLNFLITLSALIFGLLLFTSCGSTNSNDDSSLSSIEGTWSSGKIKPRGEELIVTLQLNQQGSNISGTVKVKHTESADTDTYSLKNGIYDAPILQAVMESSSVKVLTCTAQSPSKMKCEIDLAETSEVTFMKQ